MDYRQYVRQQASAMGIDPYVAEAWVSQESGWNPNAVSKAGAIGLTQLMPGTAADLRVDPKNPVQNIDGGLKYLRQQMDRFGDINLALAAYNGGPNRLERLGKDVTKMPEETQKYAPSILARAEQLRGGKAPEQPVGQQQSDAGMPAFDDLIGGLENARAAGNEEAVQWFSQQVRPQLDQALINARASSNTEASEFFRKKRSELGIAPTFAELGAKIYKRVEGKEFSGTPQEAEEYAKSFEAWKNNVFSQGKKALAVGKWDNEGQIAYLDLEDKYQEEVGLGEGIARGIVPVASDLTTYAGLGFGKLIAKTGQTATKAAIRKGLEQSLAKRLAQSTAVKAGAEGAVYGAGTNAINQAGRVNAGGQDSIDGTEVATSGGLGAVIGGGVGKAFDKFSGQSAVERLARNAGSEDGLKIDAETILELAKVRDNPNFRNQSLRTEQLNQVGKDSLDSAKSALDQIGAKGISEAGANPNELYSALAKWKKANPDDLRGTEIGDAVADAITKAQRLRSLTAEQEAAGGIRKLARGALEVMPMPNAIRLAGRAVLGGSQSRKQVTTDLLSKSNLKAAQRILNDTGPSGIGESLGNLGKLGEEALRKRAAQQATGPTTQRTAKQPVNPMDKLIDKVRADNQAISDEALANQFAPPEDLLALATRRQPAPPGPQPLPDNAPILKTIDKNVKDVEAQLLKARDFQQFGEAPDSVIEGAERISTATVDDLPIMDLIRKATLEDSAMGIPDGKTYVANEIKNIMAGGKRTAAENKVALAAEKKAQTEAARQAVKDAKAAEQQARLDAFINGQLTGNMSPEAGGFQATLKFVNGTPEQITAALQGLAKERPDLAPSILDMFTPGKKAKSLYEIQNNLFKTVGKRSREDGQGVLTAAFNNVDAEGNPIRSNPAYNKGKEVRQAIYKEAKAEVKDLGLSDKAERAVKEAITDLQQGSPKEPIKVLTQVEQRLSKLSPEERAKAEPLVNSLVDRFYTTQE